MSQRGFKRSKIWFSQWGDEGKGAGEGNWGRGGGSAGQGGVWAGTFKSKINGEGSLRSSQSHIAENGSYGASQGLIREDGQDPLQGEDGGGEGGGRGIGHSHDQSSGVPAALSAAGLVGSTSCNWDVSLQLSKGVGGSNDKEQASHIDACRNRQASRRRIPEGLLHTHEQAASQDFLHRYSKRGGGLWILAGAVFLLLLNLHVVGGQALAPPPPPPAQVNVSVVTTTTATVVWGAVDSARAYRVLKSYYTVGPFLPDSDVRAAPLVAPATTFTLSSLVTGRLVYIAVASGTDDLIYGTALSPVATAMPIGPPSQLVTTVDATSYNTSAVVLTWQLPGAAALSGPLATNFAVEYSCNGAVTRLYPADIVGTRGTIFPVGGISLDQACSFTVISRNLNYNPADPWSTTSTTAGLNKRSMLETIIMLSPPGPPQSMGAIGATLTSITVAWTKDALGKAIFYQVTYAQVLDSGTRGPVQVWSTDQIAMTSTISGLQAGGTFDVTVRTRNKNDAGYQFGTTITLSVENVPTAPPAFISSITATTVEVSWSPPPSSQLLKYEIYYQNSDGSGVVYKLVVPGDFLTTVLRQTITGLTTSTPILISLRAGNLFGFGPYTNLTVTPFAAPTVAPASASAAASPVLPQSVATVSWAAVQFAAKYKIESQLFNATTGVYGAFVSLGDFQGTVTNITGLFANSTYKFRVSAGNPAGYDPTGVVSNSVTTAAIRQPLLAVSDLVVNGATSSSLILQWTQSWDDLAITEAFQIQVSTTTSFTAATTITAPAVINPYLGRRESPADANSTNGSSIRRRLLEATPTVYGNVTGLTVNTVYYIRVTPRSANTLAYSGVPFASASATPVNAAFLPVVGLQVVSILDGAASLEWQRSGLEPIIRYLVQARVAGTSTIQVQLEVMQPAVSVAKVKVDVLGLTDGLSYDFIVTPRTLNVAAYSSAPPAYVLNISFMGVPSPPVGLRVTYVGNNSVALAWDRASTFPPATNYQVTYRIGLVRFSANGIPPTPNNFLTVTGLLRGSPYEFKVSP